MAFNLTIGGLRRFGSYQTGGGGSESGDDINYIPVDMGAASTPVQRSIIEKFFGQPIDCRDYGVKCDGTEVFDASTTAGTPTITSVGGAYTYSPEDMGATCHVISSFNDVTMITGTIMGGVGNTLTLSSDALYSGSNLRMVIIRTDDSLALNNLISDVSAAGGGCIMIPRGVLTARRIVIKRKVFLCGDGQFSTKLFQMQNSNQDFIISENYHALTGTGLNYGPNGTYNGIVSDSRVPSTFGIFKMTIDGNWVLQGAPNDGICFYGNAQYMDEVEMTNIAGTALKTEASNGYAYNSRDIYAQEEGYFGRIFLRNYSVDGWDFKGPHDSEIDTVTIYDSEQRSTGWAFIMRSSANYIGAAAIKVIHAYPGTGNVSIGGASKVGTIYNDLGKLRFNGSNTQVDKVFCLGAGYNGATPCIEFVSGISHVTISSVLFSWYWGTVSAGTIGIDIPAGAENISILNFVGSKQSISTANAIVYRNRGNFNRFVGSISGLTGTGAIGADLGGQYCHYDIISLVCTNHIKWEPSGQNFHNFLSLRAYRSGGQNVIEATSKAFGQDDTIFFDGTEQNYISAPRGSETLPALVLGGDPDTGFSRPAQGRWLWSSNAVGVAELNASGYLDKYGSKRVAANVNSTSTTLANVAGLVVSLEAGKTYKFRAWLPYNADATGGHKYAISGTATATSILYQIKSTSNASGLSVISARETAIGGSEGQAGSTAGETIIEGTITVANAGTLTVQFAQNAAGGTSTVLAGATFDVKQVA